MQNILNGIAMKLKIGIEISKFAIGTLAKCLKFQYMQFHCLSTIPRHLINDEPKEKFPLFKDNLESYNCILLKNLNNTNVFTRNIFPWHLTTDILKNKIRINKLALGFLINRKQKQ